VTLNKDRLSPGAAKAIKACLVHDWLFRILIQLFLNCFKSVALLSFVVYHDDESHAIVEIPFYFVDLYLDSEMLLVLLVVFKSI